jgi:hypothetical protein
MVESESSVQDWDQFKGNLKHAGVQIAQIAQYLREGKGSREELASLLDNMSHLVGTTLPDMLVIS